MAYVRYEIKVKGKQKPDGLGFPNSEDDIKRMSASLYGVPESEIEVSEIK